MDKVKVLVTGEKNFMLHALALVTGVGVISTLHNTEEDENDEWTEFAEFVLVGSRELVDEAIDRLEQIAELIEAEEAFGGELGEVE